MPLSQFINVALTKHIKKYWIILVFFFSFGVLSGNIFFCSDTMCQKSADFFRNMLIWCSETLIIISDKNINIFFLHYKWPYFIFNRFNWSFLNKNINKKKSNWPQNSEQCCMPQVIGSKRLCPELSTHERNADFKAHSSKGMPLRWIEMLTNIFLWASPGVFSVLMPRILMDPRILMPNKMIHLWWSLFVKYKKTAVLSSLENTYTIRRD